MFIGEMSARSASSVPYLNSYSISIKSTLFSTVLNFGFETFMATDGAITGYWETVTGPATLTQEIPSSRNACSYLLAT